MREMVLNHASFKLSSELEISEWLIDVTNGMKLLFENEILTLVLRTAKPLDEITCTPNQSLYEIIHSTQNKSKRYRDARLFFFKINAKFPLLREINEKLRSKFFGAESITQGLTAEDGKPLVFCIFNGSILVSFPLSQWDTDLLDVEYLHFMNDASIEELTNQIDNLARAHHAKCIINRSRTNSMSQLKSFEELWQKRKIIFPNLEFGLDVEIQLKKLNRGLLSTIANRLMDLDQTSQIWKKDKSPYPSWTTFVTRESQSVITNDELCRERLFRSRDGNIKFYFQHARFGSNGRIHIRVELDIRTIEIGYIGRHLPL